MTFKRVDIKTGYLCNNNCKFCVQAHNKKYANKSYDEIVFALERAAKDDFSGVVFTGGEFTLRKDSLRLVRIKLPTLAPSSGEGIGKVLSARRAKTLNVWGSLASCNLAFIA